MITSRDVIFLYFPIHFHSNDVIYKSADVNKNTGAMTKVNIANKTCYYFINDRSFIGQV